MQSGNALRHSHEPPSLIGAIQSSQATDKTIKAMSALTATFCVNLTLELDRFGVLGFLSEIALFAVLAVSAAWAAWAALSVGLGCVKLFSKLVGPPKAHFRFLGLDSAWVSATA